MLFQSRIQYKVLDKERKWKTIVEQFLHDSFTFTEVEAQIYKVTEGRLTDFSVKAIAIVNYDDVYSAGTGNHFYKVSILEVIGEEKRTLTHLVTADDVTDAENRAEAFTRNFGGDLTIQSVQKTNILGFWHPNAELWQSDFRNRMDDLKDAGHVSGDINQTTIDFGSKKPVAA
ncbi:DUF4494 family protein [Tellurirhabdus bombi]|uniref:DUF4494 family protein n=1 Tax=Tellurirhabdus bombi TaxID=2907205 RepID=UPI001F20C97E|nr:DUF4494 family protein [Tellurirhabdus bombi]